MAAVKKAHNGNKLEVRGVCKGQTTIQDKRLRIIGVRTKKLGARILRSNGKARVLTIKGPKADVTLKKISGHTEGSMSLLVRRPSTELFLVGDL